MLAIVNAPRWPACMPNGQRYDLERDAGSPGGRDQSLQLLAHHFGVADLAAQHVLVDHHPQHGSVVAVQDRLPLHACRRQLLDLFVVVPRVGLDQFARVRLGLEPDTIVSTGGRPIRPAPNGTSAGGNHRSHCASSPGS